MAGMGRRTGRVARGVVVALTVAGALSGTAHGAPPPPQDDPFYVPDPGYETASPGTILRSRPVRAALYGVVPVRGQAWQVLYRTTNTKGLPQATVTTVLVPHKAAPRGNRPLVSYQPAEDSAAPQCAPSYGLLHRAPVRNPVAQAETLLIGGLLARGYAVSVPDYEGPKAEYGAGRQAGQATLDGIRAALRFSPAGLRGAETPVGMWGYSGGALATGWASELQPTYAPELTLAGVATGGLPVNLERAYYTMNRGPFAGLAVGAITGLSHAYPELDALLDEILTARGRGAIAYAERHCNAEVAARYAFTDVNKLTTLARPLDHPVAQAVLADTVLGKDLPGVAPKAPTYVYHSTNDELVTIREVDALVPRYCATGTPVLYDRDRLSEHISLVVTGAPRALGWLTDRLEGRTPPPAGCQTRTTASTLNSPRSIRELGRFLFGLPVAFG